MHNREPENPKPPRVAIAFSWCSRCGAAPTPEGQPRVDTGAMQASAARHPGAAAAQRRQQRVVRAAAARGAKGRSPPPPAPASAPAAAALPAALNVQQQENVIRLELEPQLEKELQENGGQGAGPADGPWAAACVPCPAPARICRRRSSRLPRLGLPAAAGFRSTRRTKLIATIGPACDSEEMLEQMAVRGPLRAPGGTHTIHLCRSHGSLTAAVLALRTVGSACGQSLS